MHGPLSSGPAKKGVSIDPFFFAAAFGRSSEVLEAARVAIDD